MVLKNSKLTFYQRVFIVLLFATVVLASLYIFFLGRNIPFLFSHHPKLTNLTWFGIHYRVLMIIVIILFVSLGSHALFSEKTGKPKNGFKTFNFTFYQWAFLALLFATIVSAFLYISFIERNLPSSKPSDLFVARSFILSAAIIYMALLFIRPIDKSFWATGMIAALILELLIFFYASDPFRHHYAPGKMELLQSNINKKSVMPDTLQYIHTKHHAGVQYYLGGTHYGQSSSSLSFLQNRRAFMTMTQVNDLSIDKYYKLLLAGISGQRYFFSDQVLVVDRYTDIFSAFKRIFSHEKAALLRRLPLIMSKTEPRYLNKDPISIPKKQAIHLYSDLDEYARQLFSHTGFDKATRPTLLLATDFKRVFSQKNHYVIQYNNPLPKIPSLATEANAYENIALHLIDRDGNKYYPVTGDLFHMEETHDIIPNVIVINAERFFSTYYDGQGNIRLYISLLKDKDIPDFFMSVDPDAKTKRRFNLPLAVRAKQLLLEPGDFSWKGYDGSKRLVEYRTVLPQEVPGYLSPPLGDRYTLENDRDRTSKVIQADRPFTLDNHILTVDLKWMQNPYIEFPLYLHYTTVTREIYDREELTILEEKPDYAKLQIQRPKPSMLIVRNTYSRFWKAEVDGENVPIYIINGLFCGVMVPGGNHVVEFRYNPYGLLRFIIKMVPVYGIMLPLLLAAYPVLKRRLRFSLTRKTERTT